MASEKLELTKKVDVLSSRLLDFAENLTKFSQITNKKYEDLEKICHYRTNKNSETIFTLIDMLKGHGLKLRDVESELTDINETVDERFEKVSEKLKTLSKNYKQILKVLTGNSKNIERLFNKIKDKGKDGDEVREVRDKSLVHSERDFKEDEEPTARMMELVSSFSPKYWQGDLQFSVNNDDEIFVPSGKIGTSTYILNVYNRDGVLLRELQNNKLHETFYNVIQRGSPLYRMIVNNDKIFFTDTHTKTIVIFDTQGRYIETISKSVSDNGVLHSLFERSNLEPISIGKYPIGTGDGQFNNMSNSCVIIAKNGNVFVSNANNKSGYTDGITMDTSLRIQVFDSEGNFLRKFPIEDTLYNRYQSTFGKFHFMCISDNELFVQTGGGGTSRDSVDFISVYNLDGKFLYKFSAGKNKNGAYRTIKSFQVMNSGDVCISCFDIDGTNTPTLFIYKRGYQYIQRPLERKYKFYLHSEVEKQLDDFEGKKILSISFPLCVYQYNSGRNTLQPNLQWNNQNCQNLLTHTIYFQKPQSLKKAVQAVEEYFNGSVTKSDFQVLQSGCLFGYIEGRFASRDLNWETCNYNRLCRGYFLGGNVLSGIRIRDDTELVLDITQD